MNPSEGNLNPNPRIKSITIGTRELRKVKVYPLSAGHQFEVVEMVSTLLAVAAEQQEQNDLSNTQVVELMRSVLQDKVGEILGFVTDPEDKVTLYDFDNMQLAEFAEILFEVNFGDVLKKFLATWDKAKGLFPSQKSLQK